MSELTIGGESFNVLMEGEESLPVLLLCHPLGGDLHIWDVQMPEFLKHFRVLRYDARGHGESTIEGGPYSIRKFGEDALAILDAFEVDKASLIGTSMGGAVVQWLLVNAPDRCERAVLANTAAQFGPSQRWNERIETALRDGMRGIADATIERWFDPGFSKRNNDLVAPVRQTLSETQPSGYAKACAALRDADLRDSLGRISRPVLIVAGRDDPSVTTDQLDVLATTIEGAKTITLNTRHISSVEDAPGFTKAVLEFLTARLSARRSAKPKRTARPLPVPRRMPGRHARTRSPSNRAVPASKPNDGLASKPALPRKKIKVGTPGKLAQRRGVPEAATRKTPVKAAPAKKAAAVAKKPPPVRASAQKPKAERPAAAKAKGSAKGSAKESAKARIIAKTAAPRPRSGRGATAAKSTARTTSAVPRSAAKPTRTEAARAKAAPKQRSAPKKPAPGKPTSAVRKATPPAKRSRATAGKPAAAKKAARPAVRRRP